MRRLFLADHTILLYECAVWVEALLFGSRVGSDLVSVFVRDLVGSVFLTGGGLRLIPMRLRFRASDLGQVAKINLVRANRNRLLVRNRMRWCSGHLFVCSCDSAVTFLDSENSNQRRLLLCLAPRRDAPNALRSARDSSIQACAD